MICTANSLVPSPLVEGRWVQTINGLRRPSGLALTSNGNIIIAETNCVKLITTGWDTVMTIPWCHPFCVGVTKNDFILVVDNEKQKIHELTLDGQQVFSNQSNVSKCHMEWPAGMAIGNENIYIVDRNSHRIHIFNSNLQFLTSFGNKGVKIGQMKFPSGIVNDDNGIYVADSLNHRIQKFTYDGDCVASFGHYGCREGELNQPTAISIDCHGILYVAETGNHRISTFTYDGQFLGSHGKWGVLKGQLRCPCSLAVSNYDEQCKLYICDYLNNRIQIF